MLYVYCTMMGNIGKHCLNSKAQVILGVVWTEVERRIV